jgi:uncharacterized protein YciI
MLFMIAGYLAPGAEERLIDFRNEFNEQLSQTVPNLVAGGALRDRDGRRQGYLGFIEADDIEAAERFLHQSPFYREKLYDRVEVYRYDVEIGDIR